MKQLWQVDKFQQRVLHLRKLRSRFFVAVIFVTFTFIFSVSQSFAAGCLDAVSYGADPTGATYSNAAWTAMVTAIGSGNGCISFSAGKYKFSSQLTYTFPTKTSSLTVVGAGADVTELTWPLANGGIRVNFIEPPSFTSGDSIHFRDFSCTTGVAGGGSCIDLVQADTGSQHTNWAQSDISRVTARGADGYFQTDYWNTGANIVNVSMVNFDTFFACGPNANVPLPVAGIGISIVGASDLPTIVYNIINSTFNYLNVGINYGAYTQGVAVSTSNFVGNNYGIHAPPGAAGLVQLAVTSSQFNNLATDIYTESAIAGVQLQNNLFFSQGSVANGVYLAANDRSVISGNIFYGSGTASNGVAIGPTTGAGGVITGNHFEGFTYGVALLSGSAHFNVQSNSYINNTNIVSNAGTGNTIGGGSP